MALLSNRKHTVYNKRINGKSYSLWATTDRKKEAESIAEDERKKGNLARVFKFKGVYEVYTSWRKR